MSRRGINKVILVGNFGDAPELRFSGAQEPIANFTLATSEVWKDKHTGQSQERTEWHKCVVFGPLANVVNSYAQKGTKAYCEGELRTRKWTDSNGVDRYTTQIVVNEFQVLANGVQVQQQPPVPGGQPVYTQQQRAPQQDSRAQHFRNQNMGGPPPDARYNPNGSQVSPYQSIQPYSTGPVDDDIPF